MLSLKTDDYIWLNDVVTYIRQLIYPYLPYEFSGNEVYDNVYIGSYSDTVCLKELKNEGITHILSAVNVDPFWSEEFVYEKVPYRDSENENIMKHMNKAIEFIEDARKEGKVFVHCFYGVSRSTSLVMGYLLMKEGYTYEEALEIIKHKRNIANPNKKFEKQLREIVNT